MKMLITLIPSVIDCIVVLLLMIKCSLEAVNIYPDPRVTHKTDMWGRCKPKQIKKATWCHDGLQFEPCTLTPGYLNCWMCWVSICGCQHGCSYVKAFWWRDHDGRSVWGPFLPGECSSQCQAPGCLRWSWSCAARTEGRLSGRSGKAHWMKSVLAEEDSC